MSSRYTLVRRNHPLLSPRPQYTSTPSQVHTWRPHKLPVSDVSFDASGGIVATASADRSVKVWDVQGGFCTHHFTGHQGVVLRVIFHPKQASVAYGAWVVDKGD